MTDMPMTSPGQWGKNKPRNLQEALAGVRTSLKMVDDAKKPRGAVGGHSRHDRGCGRGSPGGHRRPQ